MNVQLIIVVVYIALLFAISFYVKAGRIKALRSIFLQGANLARC